MKRSLLFIRLFFIFYVVLTPFFVNKIGFSFLSFNLLLAYIPFELSLIFYKTKSRAIKILTFIPWLLFYPNGLYLLTDYFHLTYLNVFNVPTFNLYIFGWFIFTLASIGIFFGVLISTASLFIIIRSLSKSVLKFSLLKVIFVLSVSLLVGFGIFLGRFPRLHTHHLISHPMETILEITSSLNSLALEFTLIIGVLHLTVVLVLYATYTLLNNMK